jgi:hypothetical protein
MKLGLLENSKSRTQHVYKKGHRESWNEDKILETGNKSSFTKQKDLAHVAC